MPSALRLVRSGIAVLALAFCTSTYAGIDTPTTCSAPAATSQLDAVCGVSHAAVMDLWLATSLALIVLYVRRRRREKLPPPSAAQARDAVLH